MLEKLREAFDLLDVYYEIVSDKEIRVVCPIDAYNEEKYRNVSQKEVVDMIRKCDYDEAQVLSDEGCISIVDCSADGLSWLGIVPLWGK